MREIGLAQPGLTFLMLLSYTGCLSSVHGEHVKTAQGELALLLLLASHFTRMYL